MSNELIVEGRAGEALTDPLTLDAPLAVPSMVEAPEGAVLARWTVVPMYGRYETPTHGTVIRREWSGLYMASNPNPLVWYWPEPDPVVAQVSVEILRRLIDEGTASDEDITAVEAAIEDAEAES